MPGLCYEVLKMNTDFAELAPTMSDSKEFALTDCMVSKLIDGLYDFRARIT